MTVRILMVSESNWGFSIGDDHSGFSEFGYATKQAAQEAAGRYAL